MITWNNLYRINDANIVDAKEDEDSKENDDKIQNIYNQLQEVLNATYSEKSRFEKVWFQRDWYSFGLEVRFLTMGSSA